MSAVLSFIGWTFLPRMATGWLLTIYYRIMTRAGDPIPKQGNPRYTRDYRRVHIAVVSLYLIYTIYESYYQLLQAPTYYQLLGIPFDVDERTLRSKFRRLSVQFHPDKMGNGDDGSYFVMLKQAYDTLSDPAKRWGYDRFGVDIHKWKHCVTVYDYLQKGAAQLVPWYFGGLLLLVILTVLGKLEFGGYWRYSTFFSMAAIEMFIITRPYHLSTCAPLAKPLLQFEQLTLIRKIVFTTFIAISQLGPMVADSTTSAANSTEVLQARLDKLAQIASFTDMEAEKVLTHEYIPFAADEGSLKGLQRRMGEWFMEQKIRSDPEVRDAMGNALRRRRQNAPAGAKGTR